MAKRARHIALQDIRDEDRLLLDEGHCLNARRKDDGVVYAKLKPSNRYKRSVSLVWRREGLNAGTISLIAKHLATARGAGGRSA